MSGQKRGGGGVLFAVAALRMSSAESLRRLARLEVPKADRAKATLVCSRDSRAGVAGPEPPRAPPLSPIALAKRPWARGDAIWALTEMEPADSPKMVTLAGSPPKAAMLFLTQVRAAVWSRRP